MTTRNHPPKAYIVAKHDEWIRDDIREDPDYEVIAVGSKVMGREYDAITYSGPAFSRILREPAMKEWNGMLKTRLRLKAEA